MSNWLEVDERDFMTNYGRSPFRISHRLVGHPSLAPERLVRLVEELPGDLIEHHRGDVPLVVPDGDVPRVAASAGDVARTIEENGSWMLFRRIEESPEYRELVDGLLAELEPLVLDVDGPIIGRVAFLFLSAPAAITPVHFDGEHNFLLQIQRSKEICIGAFSDEATFQRAAERSERFLPDLPEHFERFHLEPGDGVYVPMDAPHWVHNGPATSVSLSITFSTPSLIRAQRVHRFNAKLRRLGLSPRPPGHSPARDRAKASAVRGAQAMFRRFPRSGAGRRG